MMTMTPPLALLLVLVLLAPSASWSWRRGTKPAVRAPLVRLGARGSVARKSVFASLQGDAETLGRGKLIADFDASDFPPSWPYTAADLSRMDEADDAFFYMQPRFVTHIDDKAIAALSDFYGTVIGLKQAEGVARPNVLDLCSSWISHLPTDAELGNVVGVGLNSQELDRNPQLTSYAVQNLNDDPELKLADSSQDLVLCCVSIDYLTRPLEVCREIHRVLSPGGMVLLSFSNRFFYTKAVSAWLKTDDIGRIAMVGNYLHFAAEWESIKSYDLVPGQASEAEAAKGGNFLESLARALGANLGMAGDPMYVVVARKKAE